MESLISPTVPVSSDLKSIADLLVVLKESGRLTTLLESAARLSDRENLGRDILYGAEAIAKFLLGDTTARRKIYRMAEHLPVFRIGLMICARRSVLLTWIAAQEAVSHESRPPASPASRGIPPTS